jgi:hypothetical protein
MNNNTPFTKSISLTDLGIENAKTLPLWQLQAKRCSGTR